MGAVIDILENLLWVGEIENCSLLTSAHVVCFVGV